MVDPVEPQPSLPHHRLSRRHLDALCAGGGGPDLVRQLWQTQRSRRLLLLHAVVEAARAEPRLLGPLPTADTALEALVRAEQAAPAEFTELLLQPQIGNWAAYALRRRRGGAHTHAPIWIDFGALHSVALVAAARAGLHWRTRLPVRTGRVMLPSLGMAVLSERTGWGQVVAECADGTIRIGARGEGPTVPVAAIEEAIPGWWNLRQLTIGSDPGLRIVLDDIDPYRELADPVAPDRLDATAVARWSDLLAGAWRILCTQHGEDAEAIAAGLVSVVPLPGDDNAETRSASTGEAFGLVLVSTPPDELALAVSLVHEFQHIKLGGLMHLLALSHEPDDQTCYAPWRDDPRPLSGLLQGVYAFVGITRFWRARRLNCFGTERQIADLEYAYARAQVREALVGARQCGGLTPWGERLLLGLINRIEPWLGEPLPARAVRAAELVAADHRTGWRIRHLHPSRDDVRRLARAWSDDRGIRLDSYRPDLIPHQQARWSQGLLALARRYVAGDSLALGPRLRASGLSEADVVLLQGDDARARDGYRTRIAADADDLRAWAGLGLTDLGVDPGSVLLRHPELVRAVYLEAVEAGAAPDPIDLTAWLEHATATLTA
ncbi:HEXXH motif domain-containing protein [Plantactinospora sp. WMMC1484]|uniref:HEXXH motif domain-containing protein n=1 Tax=Plantactinospora sp. WMMC1484 TaxID=3404122 RepID=UPI003BF49430